MGHIQRGFLSSWCSTYRLILPTSILWIFCVTSWVGAYLLLERVFQRIEFPTEKTMNRFAEEY